MNADKSSLYDFAFRGLLAEEALDRAGRRIHYGDSDFDLLVDRVGLSLLDDDLVAEARRMSVIYMAVAAFENSARRLVTDVLVDEVGEGWWEKAVSEKIRKRAESRRSEEQKVKWHASRGEDPIYYTELGDLLNIMRNNVDHFVPAFVPSIEWVSYVFDSVVRSRNVIMHSGSLTLQDVERVGIHVRDWVAQVGA